MASTVRGHVDGHENDKGGHLPREGGELVSECYILNVFVPVWYAQVSNKVALTTGRLNVDRYIFEKGVVVALECWVSQCRVHSECGRV